MTIISRILVRFLIVLYSVGTNIAIAQMGLHGNHYLSGSQSLAIENEALEEENNSLKDTLEALVNRVEKLEKEEE